tara:strand:+ start:343 stop:891 length:549 start_codon:yes stop_codon:yes gene_type:complete
MIHILFLLILIFFGGSTYQAYGETIEDIIKNNELVNVTEIDDIYKVKIIQLVRNSEGMLVSITSNVYSGIIPTETLEKSLDMIFENKKILLFPWLGIEEFQTVSASEKNVISDEKGKYEKWQFAVKHEQMERTFYADIGIFDKFETSNRVYVIKLLDAQFPGSMVDVGDKITWIFEIQKKIL